MLNIVLCVKAPQLGKIISTTAHNILLTKADVKDPLESQIFPIIFQYLLAQDLRKSKESTQGKKKHVLITDTLRI